MGMMFDKWGCKFVILLGFVVFVLGSFVVVNVDSMVMMIVGCIF